MNRAFPNIWQSILLSGLIPVAMFAIAMITMLFHDSLSERAIVITSYVAAMIFICGLGHRLKQADELSFRPNLSLKPIGILPYVILGIIGIGICLEPLLTMIPISENMRRGIELIGSGSILSFFALVIFPGVLEEYFFRGIVLDGLVKRIGDWPAILLSSFLFGAIHLNWLQFVGAFLIGLFIGWIYIRSGSLAYAILAHTVNNFIGWLRVTLGYSIDHHMADLFETSVQHYFFVSLAALVSIISIFLIYKHLSQIGTSRETL